MAIGFPAAGLILALALTGLAACDDPAPGVTAGPRSAAEENLARQSRALQRSVWEGAVAGAVAGEVFAQVFSGDDRPRFGTGLSIGLPLGAAAGSYVGYLQQQYSTRERRLDRVRADVDRTNAELSAAIATSRAVLAQQQRELQAIRASGATAQSPELGREVAQAQANLTNMQRAIDGADRRRADFASTRALGIADSEVTGIDPQIAELAMRIQTLRQIAGTLAGDI